MRKIRCGVIGAGWWSTFAHIPAILRHPHAELTAVQKRDLNQARKVAADFSAAHACSTVEDLLALDLDAVIVGSTPNAHYAQAVAALRCGIPVLVEKPLCLAPNHAREMVELARERNLPFLVSCPWHYTAHAREARRRIAAGELGTIKMISVLMTNPVAHLLKGEDMAPTYGTSYLEPRPGSYCDPEVAGGGQIYTQFSHLAAYVSFLLDAQPAEVFARFDHDGSAVDIYNAVSLRMDSGTIVSVATTGAVPDNPRTHEVRVFGTKGMLYLELWEGTMIAYDLASGARDELPRLPAEEVYPHEAPARNLIDCVLGIAENGSPGWLGCAAVLAIDAACTSARIGANVRLGHGPGNA